MNVLEQSQKHSLIAWLIANEIKTEDGLPYSFKNHKFMFHPLQSMYELEQDVVCLKAAQIGFSTAAIFAALWIANYKNTNIIYTLPTFDFMRQFAGGKINRLISNNDIIKEWIDGSGDSKDTVFQKKVGKSMIYFRGASAENQAISISAELNIYDEVDATPPQVIEQYATRLQAAKLKGVEPREWFFSHPSAPDFGVDRQWATSDKRFWYITCPHCKEEHYMDFPDSFDLKENKYICKLCKGLLKNEDRRNGKWKPTSKGEKAGYWIPLWLAPWVEAKEVIKYHKDKSPEYFENKVRGMPYAGGGNKLTREMFFSNLTQEVLIPDVSGRVYIGVDTGLINHIVVGTEKGIFYWESTSDRNKIDELLNRWSNAILVIDAGGEPTYARNLRERYIGRVFLCVYRSSIAGSKLLKWGARAESGMILADRNRCIQTVVDEFTDKRIKVQGTRHDWEDYYKHWSNMTRVEEVNERTGLTFKRWNGVKPDHLAHATVYWRIAVERFGVFTERSYSPQEFDTQYLGYDKIILGNSFETLEEAYESNTTDY